MLSQQHMPSAQHLSGALRRIICPPSLLAQKSILQFIYIFFHHSTSHLYRSPLVTSCLHKDGCAITTCPSSHAIWIHVYSSTFLSMSSLHLSLFSISLSLCSWLSSQLWITPHHSQVLITQGHKLATLYQSTLIDYHQNTVSLYVPLFTILLLLSPQPRSC